MSTELRTIADRLGNAVEYRSQLADTDRITVEILEYKDRYSELFARDDSSNRYGRSIFCTVKSDLRLYLDRINELNTPLGQTLKRELRNRVLMTGDPRKPNPCIVLEVGSFDGLVDLIEFHKKFASEISA